MTVEQYLGYDDAADCRTEFRGGEIFRLDDVSVQHARLVVNVIIELGNRLKGGPCEALGGARFQTVDEGFVCPDVAVIRGSPA